MTRPRIAITTGEPAGIGPEISVLALADALDADITLIGDETLLAARARDGGRCLADVRADSARAARRRGARRAPRRAQRALRAGDARSRDRRRARRRLRRSRHRPGPEERDQRRRHSVHRPHRVPGRALACAAGGDDAGRGHAARRAARGAGDDAPAARARAGSADGRRPGRRDAGAVARPHAPLRHRRSRASRSPGSIRTPAKAGTSDARRSR